MALVLLPTSSFVGKPDGDGAGKSGSGWAHSCRSDAQVGQTAAVMRLDGRRRHAVLVTLILVLVVACALVFYAGERDANRKDCIAVTGHFPDPVTSEMVRC